jgi:hypothetical protein
MRLPRDMSARIKLAEAEYFFLAIKRTLHNPDKLNYNLSAFFSAWRSIPDVMLYDFANRYSLGFTEEDRLTAYEFRIAARVLNEDRALQFLKWWNQRCEKIRASPLYRKRNIVVHRGKPVLRYVVYLPTSLASELDKDSRFDFGIETYRGKKAILKGRKLTGSEHQSARGAKLGDRFKTTFDVEFDDFPERRIEDVCREALDEVRQFVKEAERQYRTRKPANIFIKV